MCDESLVLVGFQALDNRREHCGIVWGMGHDSKAIYIAEITYPLYRLVSHFQLQVENAFILS